MAVERAQSGVKNSVFKAVDIAVAASSPSASARNHNFCKILEKRDFYIDEECFDDSLLEDQGEDFEKEPLCVIVLSLSLFWVVWSSPLQWCLDTCLPVS